MKKKREKTGKIAQVKGSLVKALLNKCGTTTDNNSNGIIFMFYLLIIY